MFVLQLSTANYEKPCRQGVIIALRASILTG